MMTPLEYAGQDGLGLAALIRRGEVSAAEVLDVAIARIERHNPTLNAVNRSAARIDRLAPAFPRRKAPVAHD